MSDLRFFGATSNLVEFTLKRSDTGQGLTGLTFSSTGLIISTKCDVEATPTVYTSAGSTIETIATLGTFATPTATKCRLLEVDAVNHPGLYQFQFANARFAVTNAKRLIISVPGVTGLTLLGADYEIELLRMDLFAAVLPVNVTQLLGTAWLTPATAGTPDVNAKLVGGGTVPSGAIPNAVAGATGGVFIAGVNAATSVTTALTANITGNLSGSVGSVTAGVTLAAAAVQAIWDALTTALTTAGSIGKRIADFLTGDSFARLGAPVGASVSVDVAAIKTDTTALTTRVSAARAGYLDNLNVGGNVASSAEAVAIQNNTRVVRVVPEVLERPDSGTATYRIELLLYDENGNMEAPDSAPTIALVNQAGTDRSGRLDSATMALISAGRYRAIYTANVADTLEQLVWTFSVIEGGATRLYGNQSLIVDTTAVDFTAADRAKLDTLHDTRIPGVIQPQTGDSFARLGAAGAGLTALGDTRLANLDAAVSSRSTYAGGAVASVTADVGITQAAADKVWNTTTRALTDKAGFALSTAGIQALWDRLTSALTTVGSIGKLIVDNLNAAVTTRAAAGDAMALTTGERDTLTDAIVDQPLTGHTTSGTVGGALNSASSAGDPWSTMLPGGYASGSAGNLVGNNLDSSVSSRLPITSYLAPDNTVIGIVNAKLGGLAGSGTNTLLGLLRAVVRKDIAAPSDIGGAYDPATDSQEAIRDRGDVAWSAAGAAPTVAQIRTEIDANSTQLAAIRSKTDALPAAPADETLVIAATTAIQGTLAALNNLSSAQAQSAVAAALTAYAAATGGQVSASTTTIGSLLAALNNLSAAQVKAQVVAALSVDGYAEPPAGTPPATTNLVTKVGFLYKAYRNRKSSDGVTEQLFDATSTSVDQKTALSEVGGVVTKDAVVSGP